MKVAILWVDWTGYMDACAQELQRLLACELDIVFVDRRNESAPFALDEFFHYPCNYFALNGKTMAHLESQSYDLILICGWHIPPYRELAHLTKGRSIRVLCMDNQWLASMSQYLGIVAFRVYLRRYYDFAFVPGSRQAKFAHYLGFGLNEIIEGHYACATEFARASRVSGRHSFLYAGRLVVEKGVQELVDAWRIYVHRHSHPWNLKICGVGPLSHLVTDLPFTERLGFVQPSQMPAVMAQSTVLVLPSLFEPWGVIVQEAAQSGLGLIVTSACGSADYFLRDQLNGRLVPPGEASALCRAFEWFHDLDGTNLEQVSQRSIMLSAQRSPLSWACCVSRALALERKRSFFHRQPPRRPAELHNRQPAG
jgi:glycosyltransferase involved in cell wall biosynthesis